MPPCPGSVRSLRTLDLPPAVSEQQVLDELRRLAASNTVAEPMIGLGYFGTITPGVIRRNVLESPAWYTAYTPVPARDQPRPAGGVAQFPDDGERSHRPRHGERVAARREHRSRRGGHAHAPPGDQRVQPRHRRRRLPAANHRGPGYAVGTSRDHTGRRRSGRRRALGRLLRHGAAISRVLRRCPGLRSTDGGGARPGCSRDGGDRPARPDAPEAAGGVGCRRRGGLVPTLRRAALVRRAPRRLHGDQGRPRARPARPTGRALHRRRGPAGVPPGAADS